MQQIANRKKPVVNRLAGWKPAPLLSFAIIALGLLGAAELATDEYMSYVKYLASPEMRGRATGSPELEKCAAFIAGKFRALGLQPIHGDSYYQDFEVTTSARLGPHNSLSYTERRHKGALKLQQDYVPLNLSAPGRASGEVVFAGYGITAPEYNYDDYAGIDVKDKLVIVLRHEPQEFDEKSVFDGKVYTAHSQIFAKAVNAKLHGARGVLLVNDVAAHPGDEDKLEKFGTTEGPGNSGVDYVQVKADVVKDWLAQAGKDLRTIEADIDKTLKPESFALPVQFTIDLNVDVEREIKTVHNAGAYLPGDSDEYVIVGAHYDHLGTGRAVLVGALAGRDRASGRGRQRIRHGRRAGAGPLVFAGAETQARRPVLDLRGRGAGVAGVELLREPSRAAAQECGRDDQHGHDRARS